MNNNITPLQDKLDYNYIQSVNKYNKEVSDIESILINTHLVFNTLNLLKRTTDSTYTIYVACKFLNHNITTTTIKKWLKNKIGLKLTYTTIKTHLNKLKYLGYISEYSYNENKFRLENEFHITQKHIYGNQGNNKNRYWKDENNEYIIALKNIRQIDITKFSKKEIISTPYIIDKRNINKTYKYQSMAKSFNLRFKKQTYIEKRNFIFFEDYNTLTNGYGSSRIKLNENSLREFKNKKYSTMRTYIDEQLTLRFWYNRNVTKSEIIRVLHTTKASIDQFKCNRYHTFITGIVEQNKEDRHINYKTVSSKRKAKFVKEFDVKRNKDGNIIRKDNETDEQLGYRTFNTCVGNSYYNDTFTTKIIVTENVHKHMYFDDNNYITNKEFIESHPLAMEENVDNKTKVRFNKETKAKGNVTSIGLEELQLTPNHRRVIEEDGTVIVARRRTNNSHLPAYHSEFKSKWVMPKLHERHYLLYQIRNLKRIQYEILSLSEKQAKYEYRKSLAEHFSNNR